MKKSNFKKYLSRDTVPLTKRQHSNHKSPARSALCDVSAVLAMVGIHNMYAFTGLVEEKTDNFGPSIGQQEYLF
jgi:hypothetical protein